MGRRLGWGLFACGAGSERRGRGDPARRGSRAVLVKLRSCARRGSPPAGAAPSSRGGPGRSAAGGGGPRSAGFPHRARQATQLRAAREPSRRRPPRPRRSDPPSVVAGMALAKGDRTIAWDCARLQCVAESLLEEARGSRLALAVLAVASPLALFVFLVGDGRSWAAWLMALLVTAFPVALAGLGAARGGRAGRLGWSLAALFVLLAGSMTAILLAGRQRASPRAAARRTGGPPPRPRTRRLRPHLFRPRGHLPATNRRPRWEGDPTTTHDGGSGSGGRGGRRREGSRAARSCAA